MGLPFSATTMSPICSPAFAAGPPGVTSLTSTPHVRESPSPAARSGVMVWARAPISPRRTRLVALICSYTLRTMLLGAANPMPSLPPDCEKIRVLIPITRPSRSSSGPPLLPGLMLASVWT